ncbi:MAG TPA: N-6 DNA methylase, partial [Opitutaceae bacterium]
VSGAVYTPYPIVESMLAWIESQGIPSRIVDPGAGSGRFILAAGRVFPKAELCAVELDPLAALMLRANASVLGLQDRLRVIVGDYREVSLPVISSTTAFVGNPPYVRHHNISSHWKDWYSDQFSKMGIAASGLAGLHLHFFLQTCLLARKGDYGAFITSSEWMDVNYGASLRRLLATKLGGAALHVLEPTVKAFPGTATTASITCFKVGEENVPVRVRAVKTIAALNGLSKGQAVSRQEMREQNRWSVFVRPKRPAGAGLEIGELFRVHRGQVTGANGIWIAGAEAADLPASVKLPTVTRARDLIQAGAVLDSAKLLRRVINLPPNLERFDTSAQTAIEAFLSWAKTQGAASGYIARHRKPWWAVNLREPAPILCTYMARRPPQFTLNRCGARHINIAHGLYPLVTLKQGELAKIVQWLNRNVCTSSGRTYAGGLTKFEPKEIERLTLPTLDFIRELPE